MNKIMYINNEGNLCIVTPVAKENIEKVLGSLTDEEYIKHVYERSIPSTATNVREINDSDIPSSREFRNAWVDVTPSSKIDVCCTKAKNIALEALRIKRNNLLDKTDVEYLRSLEMGNLEETNKIKEKRQHLRNITDPLKNLDTVNKYNDYSLLQQIKNLSSIGD